MPSRPGSSLEALEARIAPASLQMGAITITTSKGSLADLTAAATFAMDGHLEKLTLGPVFRGADVSITSTDQLIAGVGDIEAVGIDLRSVTVAGDLGQINVGDNVALTPALAKLEVASLGTTLATQGTGGDLESHINGRVTSLIVHGNVGGALFVDGRGGSIGTAEISGSLTGGSTFGLGSIITGGAIGKITVTHDLVGGDGERSGSILAGGTISSAIITGNIIGGKGLNSGTLAAPNLVNVTVGGGITGGTDVTGGAASGQVFATAKIGTITVTGALTGGKTASSGSIASGRGIDSVTVSGGLIGGDGTDSGSISTAGLLRNAVIGATTQGMLGGVGVHSGSVLSSTRLQNVTVNGDVHGGDGATSGVVASAGTIGTVTVHGSVIGGNVGSQSGAIGSFRALTSVVVDGALKGGAASNSGQIVSALSLGTVSVAGNVEGGGGQQSGAIGSLGSITKITVGGDLKGGGGFESGSVLTPKNVTLLALGSITGGTNFESGYVGIGGTVNSLTVNGNVSGGPGSFSGFISIETLARSIHVDGSLIGFPGDSTTGTLASPNSGSIRGGQLLFVEVDNNLIGAEDHSGSIYSQQKITKVIVHGSLIGGADYSGSVFTEFFTEGLASSDSNLGAPLGTVTVGQDMFGGGGRFSGSIVSAGTLGSASVGTLLQPTREAILNGEFEGPLGDMQGGGGNFSGSIFSEGNMGTVAIVGSLRAVGDNSGTIYSGGNIASLTIGDSIFGGRAQFLGQAVHGQVVAAKTLGPVLIGGSVNGGSGDFGGTITGGTVTTVHILGNLNGGSAPATGSILAVTGDIGTVNIDGSITTADDLSAPPSGASGPAGGIYATRYLGTVTVGGDVTGGASLPVVISAGGFAKPTTDAQALTIRSVRVEGNMAYTQILAGYNIGGNAINGDVQIGTIEVGPDGGPQPGVWSEVDVVAGFTRDSDGGFGGGDEVLAGTGAQTRLLSKISRIIINGTIFGGNGIHGIDAELIGSIEVNNVFEKLTPGPGNDFFALTGDTTQMTFVVENPPGRTA